MIGYDLLMLLEFTYNNTMHSSTKQSSLFSNYCHRLQTDPFQIKDVGSLTVENFEKHFTTLHNEVR